LGVLPKNQTELKQQVRAALQVLIQRPAAGKALKNELAGLRSYRVGRSRIVYRLAGERTIEIVAIGPRRTISRASRCA
jgi:mRNA-degrading endonuclease RelE of RelBE toxin-antitoxin system